MGKVRLLLQLMVFHRLLRNDVVFNLRHVSLRVQLLLLQVDLESFKLLFRLVLQLVLGRPRLLLKLVSFLALRRLLRWLLRAVGLSELLRLPKLGKPSRQLLYPQLVLRPKAKQGNQLLLMSKQDRQGRQLKV